VTLVLLIPGVGMGGGTAAAAVSYVAPIGRKVGIERPDAADLNMRTGVTG
jgi:hypothetical protein